MDEEVAGALTQTAQHQFGIVAGKDDDDGKLRVSPQQVRNDR